MSIFDRLLEELTSRPHQAIVPERRGQIQLSPRLLWKMSLSLGRGGRPLATTLLPASR